MNDPNHKVTKEKKSMVFKALTELKNKIRHDKGAINLR
jgi:hypothetical protein